MSLRKNAPYADRIEEEGKIFIYEGYDVPENLSNTPKLVDQPIITPSGILTQNGRFFEAATNYKTEKKPEELVKVYEKIKNGIWAYNGIFGLKDSWSKTSGDRKVFKFRLEITDFYEGLSKPLSVKFGELEHNRLIPTEVKLAVWKRDKGQCVQCGSKDNLHFDHILPYSKGGTSLLTENIQLLCARHNLKKSNKIV